MVARPLRAPRGSKTLSVSPFTCFRLAADILRWHLASATCTKAVFIRQQRLLRNDKVLLGLDPLVMDCNGIYGAVEVHFADAIHRQGHRRIAQKVWPWSERLDDRKDQRWREEHVQEGTLLFRWLSCLYEGSSHACLVGVHLTTSSDRERCGEKIKDWLILQATGKDVPIQDKQ